MIDAGKVGRPCDGCIVNDATVKLDDNYYCDECDKNENGDKMTLTTVKLKNGSEEATPLVTVTMMHIRSLMNDFAKGGPICLFELAEFCKDSSHKPNGDTGDKLDALNLLEKREDGSFHIHDSIRNIVLSSVEGEGMDLAFGDPVVR